MKSRLKGFAVNQPMNSDIATHLLSMYARDEEKRAELVAAGTLFDGYHPEMEAVHISNAQALEKIIDKIGGWPHAGLVEQEAADAAWVIAQHAISLPDFQRRALTLLKKTDVTAAQLAMLEDRILCFEGKPQKYGTQFDWDEHGQLSPKPIADINRVDELRKAAGLPPLASKIAEMRARSQSEGEKPPADSKKREKEFISWAKKVGWR